MNTFINRRVFWLHSFRNIVNVFIPEQTQEDTTEYLHYQSIIALSLVIGSSGFPFIFIFYVMGYPQTSLVVLWSFIFFYLIPLACKIGVSAKSGSHLVSLNYYQCHLCLAILFGGVSAPNVMWFVALPMISILTGGVLNGVIWGSITVTSLMTLYSMEIFEVIQLSKTLSSEESLLIHSLGSVALTLAILGSAVAYELIKNLALERRKLAEIDLLTANQEIEKLLHSILPVPIATRLKAGETTIADEHQDVSVLFFDVVGFTVMSQRMPPSELVHLLNDLFSTMDEIVERYDLLKVKTIGDAYMVAAGVPRIQTDHAHRLALCALEMMSQFQIWKDHAYLKYNERLEIRMGMNSGSLVAGVIGLSNFAYDVWGDTVNVAARMESHGSVNNIQVSHFTYELLKDDPRFHFESRGVIPIKGKGAMEVYLMTNHQ